MSLLFLYCMEMTLCSLVLCCSRWGHVCRQSATLACIFHLHIGVSQRLKTGQSYFENICTRSYQLGSLPAKLADMASQHLRHAEHFGPVIL